MEDISRLIGKEYHNDLDIEGFSNMMKNPSYCYKFYWLEAIVNLISEDKKTTNFDELIDEMIANAWYSVMEYHIHLSGVVAGDVRDGLERAINFLNGNHSLLDLLIISILCTKKSSPMKRYMDYMRNVTEIIYIPFGQIRNYIFPETQKKSFTIY